MSDVITPAQIERRMIQLGKELDEAHQELVAAEQRYFDAKGMYEIAVGKARLDVGKRYAERGVKATIQDREDEAMMIVQDHLVALYNSEALVKAARANVTRLRTQIDIARSVSANVRQTLEVA
jgi:hypothetical protein